MDEREQLETQWAALSVAQREDLFRGWILAETDGLAPANITLFDAAGDELVDYSFASDLSSWQVAVAASVFSDASPDRALGIGEAIIEIGHLFAEEQDEREELEEYEQEDESAEGAEAAYEAAIEEAIAELEAERSELEELLSGAPADEQQALSDLIGVLERAIDALRERLEETEDASG